MEKKKARVLSSFKLNDNEYKVTKEDDDSYSIGINGNVPLERRRMDADKAFEMFIDLIANDLIQERRPCMH